MSSVLMPSLTVATVLSTTFWAHTFTAEPIKIAVKIRVWAAFPDIVNLPNVIIAYFDSYVKDNFRQTQSQVVKTIDKMFKNVSNYIGSPHASRIFQSIYLTDSKLLKIVIKRLLTNLDDIPICRKKTEQVILAYK